MGHVDSKSGNSSGFGKDLGEKYSRGGGNGIEARDATPERQQHLSVRVARE